eukprot:2721787-Amphidinium_carterae.1
MRPDQVSAQWCCQPTSLSVSKESPWCLYTVDDDFKSGNCLKTAPISRANRCSWPNRHRPTQ